MADIQALINKMTSDKAEEMAQRKQQIEQEKVLLKDLAAKIEAQGGKADENKEYNKAALSIQMKELDQRKKLATNRGAKEEIEKERQQAQNKQNTVLQKIAGGIGGILGNMKEKALAAGKGLMSILKGTLFAGLLIAVAKWLNSPAFAATVDYITNTLLPMITNFYEKTLKPFVLGIGKFFKDPSWENFKNIFDVENPLGLVLGLAGLTALFAPKLLFKGLKLGVKGFAKALALAGTGLTDLGSDVKKDAKGRTRSKTTGAFAKAETGKLSGVKNLGKGLLRGAKFLPVVGVGVTALMGLFDGVTAGLEEAKNENATKSSILRESIAGIGSGLTFGLVSQETISKGITSMTTSIGNGFNKTKEVFTEGFTKVSSFVTEMELFKFVEEKIGEIWSSIKSIFSGDFSLENFTAIFGSVTDIIFKPIDMAVNAIKNMFGFGSPDEEFSLKTLISESLSKVGEFFSNLFDLDIRALASSIMPAKVVDFIFGKKVDTESDEFKGMSALDQAKATGLYDKDLIGNSELNTDLLAKATNAQLQAILDDDDISKENIKAIKSEQSKRSGADEFAGTGRKQERQYLLPANARSGIHGYRGTEEYEDILASQNERLSLRKRVKYADMKYKSIYGTPVANDNTKRGQALNDSSSELNSAKAEGSNVVIMNNQQAPAQSNSQPVPIPVSTRDNSSSAAQSARVTQ